MDDDDSDSAGETPGDAKRIEYEIGYGKPPLRTRFQPGQSGNKQGRPKGARGLKTDLRAALSGRHTIQINGKPRRGNRQELMMMTLATRAASGDLKAQALLIPLIMQVLGSEGAESEVRQLSARDQALLDRMLEDFGEEQSE